MASKPQNQGRIILFSIGVLLLVIFMGVLILMPILLMQERNLSHYPNATPVYQRSNYQTLPNNFHWQDAYLSDDASSQIYDWYTDRFDLSGVGFTSDVPQDCLVLEGLETRLLTRQNTRLLICEVADNQRRISINRTTTLR